MAAADYPERIPVLVENEKDADAEKLEASVAWQDYRFKPKEGAGVGVVALDGVPKQLPCPLYLSTRGGRLPRKECRTLYTTSGRVLAHVSAKGHAPLPEILKQSFEGLDGQPIACVTLTAPSLPPLLLPAIAPSQKPFHPPHHPPLSAPGTGRASSLP